MVRRIAVYYPPVDNVCPEERLPDKFQKYPAHWQQIVLHGASGAHTNVGTEESHLGTFRGVLAAQKFIAVTPFLDIAKFMEDNNHAEPPVQLRTVRTFSWKHVTQDMLDLMVTSVPVRHAIVEAGSLRFIPTGTIVTEKSMGRNASAL